MKARAVGGGGSLAKRSLKIALLHYAAPPVVGGVESVLAEHARLMAAAGHRPRIVAGRGAATDERIPFVPLPLADSNHPAVLAAKEQLDRGMIPADFGQLVDEVAAGLAAALDGVEVVIAHNVCSLHKNLALTAALRRYAAGPGAPRLILWHHDLAWTSGRYRSELHGGWPWELVRQDWPEARPRHVAVSELRRGEVARLFGLPEDRIAVVPSGLDAAAFTKLEPATARLAEELDLLRAGPLLLLPVRITRRKNIELALEVTAELGRAFERPRLLVTGPPGPHNPANHSYFEELKALQAELGLADGREGAAAHFLAELSDEYLPDEVIGDLFRLADALFLPSREEGFGIPVLEAGLTGRPVICADIGALREIAGEDATYFSPEDSAAEVARLVAGRLEASATYRLRQRVRQHYTWEGIYQERIAPLLAGE